MLADDLGARLRAHAAAHRAWRAATARFDARAALELVLAGGGDGGGGAGADGAHDSPRAAVGGEAAAAAADERARPRAATAAARRGGAHARGLQPRDESGEAALAAWTASYVFGADATAGARAAAPLAPHSAH